MTIRYIKNCVLPAAYYLLPPTMAKTEASAMLLAIGMQESRFEHRVQLGGPARSFWQAEEGGGFAGVLSHPATMDIAKTICKRLVVSPTPREVYFAIKDNDILAACFARLLLFTHPQPLPRDGEITYSWNQYIDVWRPGMPHKNTWGENFKTAWGFMK